MASPFSSASRLAGAAGIQHLPFNRLRQELPCAVIQRLLVLPQVNIIAVPGGGTSSPGVGFAIPSTPNCRAHADSLFIRQHRNRRGCGPPTITAVKTPVIVR